MRDYFQSVKLLAKRLLLLLVIYQIFRVAFYLYNQQFFGSLTIVQILGGIRFDLSSIVYTNLLIILAHVVVGNFKQNAVYQRVVKILFFTINAIFLFATFVDFEYYRFTRVRSTFSLITAKGMESDIVRLTLPFLKEFWYLVLLFLLTLYVFWRTIPSKVLFSLPQKRLSFREILMQSTLMIFLLGLSILIGRGGFQNKPLNRIDALYYSTPQNSAVVLNTPFCIIKTFSKKIDIVEYKYFTSDTLEKIFSPVKVYSNHLPFSPKNIVIIILESFGQENVGFYNNGSGYTPFLDSLLAQSLVFKNSFANGKLSIDAAPSIIAGIPSLMTNSYISSTYGANTIKALPTILKEKGYHTSFFHGAFNGSQNFDKFASIAGFDQYFGKSEYPYAGGEDGAWGIFDEEFMQFFCKKQSDFSKPFFSVLFSLSSHNPYTVPEKYKGKFPLGVAKIHESIGYADYSLKQYFASAQKQEWYKNTLFVITADHTSSDGNGRYMSEIGKYTIPIAFFDPSNPTLKGVESIIFQHTDIMPYVLGYINYSGSFLDFGNDCSKRDGRFAINYSSGAYHFIYDDYYLAFNGEKTIGVYRWKENKSIDLSINSQTIDTIRHAEALLKACIQSFNNRVMKNELIP